MPKILVSITLILIALAFIPPAMIAAVRGKPSPNRPILLIHDMDRQHRPSTQQPSRIFADGRASRPKVEGAVAREDVADDDHFYYGRVDGQWVETFPVHRIDVNRALLDRGRERFNIYCSVCHGKSGYGDGIVHMRAEQIMNRLEPMGSAWVPPMSLHDDDIQGQPPGQIFHTISYGIRTMAGYAEQMTLEDRWAVTAYVMALQRSQRATVDDVPSDRLDALVPVRFEDLEVDEEDE